jgi:hypothetical protein
MRAMQDLVDRWDRIAAEVEGKDRTQCQQR